MFCKKCGKEVKDGQQFCPFCGEKMPEIKNIQTVNEGDGNTGLAKLVRWFPVNKGINSKDIKSYLIKLAIYLGGLIALLIAAAIVKKVPLVGNLVGNLRKLYQAYALVGLVVGLIQCYGANSYKDINYVKFEDIINIFKNDAKKISWIIAGIVIIAMCVYPANSKSAKVNTKEVVKNSEASDSNKDESQDVSDTEPAEEIGAEETETEVAEYNLEPQYEKFVPGTYYGTYKNADSMNFEIYDNGAVYVGGRADTVIHIPEEVVYCGKRFEVKAIDNQACSWEADITAVYIPNTVTTIGDGCFMHDMALDKVSLGNKVTYIGSCCLSDNPELSSIYIPESLYEAGENTFSNYEGDSNTRCYFKTSEQAGHIFETSKAVTMSEDMGRLYDNSKQFMTKDEAEEYPTDSEKIVSAKDNNNLFKNFTFCSYGNNYRCETNDDFAIFGVYNRHDLVEIAAYDLNSEFSTQFTVEFFDSTYYDKNVARADYAKDDWYFRYSNYGPSEHTYKVDNIYRKFSSDRMVNMDEDNEGDFDELFMFKMDGYTAKVTVMSSNFDKENENRAVVEMLIEEYAAHCKDILSHFKPVVASDDDIFININLSLPKFGNFSVRSDACVLYVGRGVKDLSETAWEVGDFESVKYHHVDKDYGSCDYHFGGFHEFTELDFEYDGDLRAIDGIYLLKGLDGNSSVACFVVKDSDNDLSKYENEADLKNMNIDLMGTFYDDLRSVGASLWDKQTVIMDAYDHDKAIYDFYSIFE